jgi:hypothetical protein
MRNRGKFLLWHDVFTQQTAHACYAKELYPAGPLGRLQGGVAICLRKNYSAAALQQHYAVFTEAVRPSPEQKISIFFQKNTNLARFLLSLSLSLSLSLIQYIHLFFS